MASHHQDIKASIANLKTFTSGDLIPAATKGLELIGWDTLELSNQKVPVDKGNLLGTSFVSEPEVKGDEITVSIEYPEKYATIQHENVALNHRTGEAKFLEKATNEKQDSYANELAGHVKKLMKKGG
ncbi:MAG: hypothetical protein GX786_10790 [Clostridiales bacterium]|nr:hypothetical protein [Clostridiales bacterium]